MTEEQRRAGLLNRIVLAYVYNWLNQNSERSGVEMPSICYRLKSAAYASKVINGFSDEERDELKIIGETDRFKELGMVHISLVVMALEVMKLHVKTMPSELRTPKLNISDKKLLQGKALYAMYMLKAKKADKEGYDKQKEVIDTTCDHAVEWYEFIRNAIMKG